MLLVFNVVEAVLLVTVVIVLLLWAKKVVAFMDLMDELTREERRLKARMEEWNTDGLMESES